MSNYLTRDQQSTLTRVINKKIIILNNIFVLFTLKSIYLKYIKYLQSVPKF